MLRYIVSLFLVCIMIVTCTACNNISSQQQNPIDHIHVEDIPNINTDMVDRIIAAREIAINDTNAMSVNWLNRIDNKTPLAELLKQQKKVDAEMTWLFATSLFDSDRFNRNPIAWAKALLNDDILWLREVAIETDSKGLTFHRLYTVRESELGGYIYLYFNFYPSELTAVFKNTVYVPNALEKNDFTSIQEGKSIDDVINISKSAMVTKVNKLTGFEEQNVGISYHLLKDGFLYVEYKNNIVSGVVYNEDYSIPNLLRYCGGETDDEQMAAKSLPENCYNYSILPQDYPQS